jgi:hypothetical protein
MSNIREGKDGNIIVEFEKGGYIASKNITDILLFEIYNKLDILNNNVESQKLSKEAIQKINLRTLNLAD